MANQTSLTDVSPILTAEYLGDRLTEWFGLPVTFTYWQYVGESKKGDSFLSDLIRIKIFGQDDSNEERHVQVVLKTIPKSACRRLTYRLDEFFQNEINFYVKVLPVLLEFQSTKNVAEPFQQYARTFAAHADGIDDVLALEDVSLQNYGSPVRQEGIDIAHCEVSLKTFAKFHALSFALRDQEPEKFERIANEVYETYYADRIWDWYEQFWARLCRIATDAVEREYPGTVYVDKIRQFATAKTYRDCSAAAADRTHGVISHGDSWTNNILFKYDNSRTPLDAKLIDFQLTRCASPWLDIGFFLYACTTQDLRKLCYDSLIRLYYDSLATQIRQLGTDPDKVYSWDTFAGEVKKYSFFGAAFAFESTPFIVLEPEDAPDMTMEGDQKMNINDVWRVEPIKTQKGRRRLADIVVHAVDRGYI